MILSPCHQLDAYLDGDLSEVDAQAYEAHIGTCAECAADFAVSRVLNDEFARLAAIQCPPDIAPSAIQIARRSAADRQPVAAPQRRYGRWASAVTLTLLLIGLASAVVWMQFMGDSTAQLQASVQTPLSPSLPPPSTEAPSRLTPNDAVSGSLADPSPQPAQASTRSVAPEQDLQPSPSTRPTPTEAPPREIVEGASPPADSVAQAQQDLMLALTLVADAQKRAGSAVTSTLGRTAGALTETHVF